MTRKKIFIVLLFLVFALNFGHSYKSIENHLYQGSFSSVIDEILETFSQNEAKQPNGIQFKEAADILSIQPGIEDSYVMTGKTIITHYANSKMIYSGFYEGKKTDSIEEFITRENWVDYEIYFSNINSHPSNVLNIKELIPDYLVYLPTGDKQTREDTMYEELKFLSDPNNPKIPKNFKFLYKTEAGFVIYKIIHDDSG